MTEAKSTLPETKRNVGLHINLCVYKNFDPLLVNGALKCTLFTVLFFMTFLIFQMFILSLEILGDVPHAF